MLAIHDIRDKLFKQLMADLGNGEKAGLNLDILSKFGWTIVELNRQFEILSTQHKELMAKQ
jgi:hypothetical protein